MAGMLLLACGVYLRHLGRLQFITFIQGNLPVSEWNGMVTCIKTFFFSKCTIQGSWALGEKGRQYSSVFYKAGQCIQHLSDCSMQHKKGAWRKSWTFGNSHNTNIEAGREIPVQKWLIESHLPQSTHLVLHQEACPVQNGSHFTCCSQLAYLDTLKLHKGAQMKRKCGIHLLTWGVIEEEWTRLCVLVCRSLQTNKWINGLFECLCT